MPGEDRVTTGKIISYFNITNILTHIGSTCGVWLWKTIVKKTEISNASKKLLVKPLKLWMP
jgi:hypothetical protein